MNFKLLSALALLPTGISLPALGQTSDHVIVEGKCSPTSGVIIDNEPLGRLYCDTAVISRAGNGNIIIQFTDKAGDDGRILGFAGPIEGRQGFGADRTQAIAVQRVYLGGGVQPVLTERGTCFINWTGLHRTGGKVSSVVCGGRGEAEGHDVQAIVALDVK